MVGCNSGRATPFLRRNRPSAIPNHQPRRNATYHSREAVQTTEAEPVRTGRERVGRGRGGAREGDGQALQQDRRTDGGAGFLGQEAKSMSAPARRAKVERSGAELSVRR